MRDLVRLGAERAAGALVDLVGSTLSVEVRSASGEPLAAVVCDVRGAVEGVIALILPLPVRDRVLAALCPGEDPESERAASALREVGNIVASHAVSAIADRLGGRITLSVPILLCEVPSVAVERMVAERGNGQVGFTGESELEGPEGGTGARLLLAGRASRERF